MNGHTSSKANEAKTKQNKKKPGLYLHENLEEKEIVLVFKQNSNQCLYLKL